MALNRLIIGSRERDSFKALASASKKNTQGVVLCKTKPNGPQSIDYVVGIVVSGNGEPFDYSRYDSGIRGRLNDVYLQIPDITAVDFHVHCAEFCGSDGSLKRNFSRADEVQLALNAREHARNHKDYLVLFGSPTGLSLNQIIASDRGYRLTPSGLESAADSSVCSDAEIDAAHEYYSPILTRFKLEMYRVPPAPRPRPGPGSPSGPDSRAPPSCAKPAEWYAGNYFLTAGLIGLSYPADAISQFWFGCMKEIYHYGSYGMFAAGTALGAYTLLTHLRASREA